MIVFVSAFIVYLYTLFGCVAPYRDTGEMVSTAHTLGIAHPPGYPLYTLMSKVWLLILPFGSEGYRLNVLSALGGAATAYLFYRLLLAINIRKPAAALISLVFAFSYLQWYLSLVSEMYTLNTTAAAAVMLLLWMLYSRQPQPCVGKQVNARTFLFFTAFIFGACLGIRMDLLMVLPAALIVVYSKRKVLDFKDIFYAGLFFAAGAAVFLYLPFRSNAGSILDWNHPATLERLWGTIGRKTHGGTLDLISAPYESGANFPSSMKFYFTHLFTGFAYAGPLFGLMGLYSLWKREKIFSLALFMAWFFSGPLFIYLANMPPNPHALAILEAHFILPNLFVAVFMAEGVSYGLNALGFANMRASAPVLCAALLGIQLYNGNCDLQKRWNLVAYDYSKNILRSLPPNSILVMKKDVQLFALWNRQYVTGDRKDAAIVGQGLSGSPWYQTPFAKLHPDVRLCPLKDAGDWKALVELNPGKNVFFSADADYSRPDGFIELPTGLLCRIAPKGSKPDPQNLSDAIYPYRGEYVYGAYREFFTPDIIEDYSRSRVSAARYYIDKADYTAVRYELESAVCMQPFFPQAFNLMAYTFVTENKYQLAEKYYQIAVEQSEKLFKMAVDYATLDDTRDSIRKEISETSISLGVCAEKNMRDDQALSNYSAALVAWPGQTRAYFNRSVIYWKRADWPSVIRELEQALRIEPNYKEAAYYLELAKRKMEQH